MIDVSGAIVVSSTITDAGAGSDVGITTGVIYRTYIHTIVDSRVISDVGIITIGASTTVDASTTTDATTVCC